MFEGKENEKNYHKYFGFDVSRYFGDFGKTRKKNLLQKRCDKSRCVRNDERL